MQLFPGSVQIYIPIYTEYVNVVCVYLYIYTYIYSKCIYIYIYIYLQYIYIYICASSRGQSCQNAAKLTDSILKVGEATF